MTASIQNTHSAFAMLKRALAYARNEAIPATERLFHLEIQIDSVLKCLSSLAAQVRFYQSASASNRQPHALRLPLPNLDRDAVVYGDPEDLEAIKAALDMRGVALDGPATLQDLAAMLAARATLHKPDPGKENRHGNVS